MANLGTSLIIIDNELAIPRLSFMERQIKEP